MSGTPSSSDTGTAPKYAPRQGHPGRYPFGEMCSVPLGGAKRRTRRQGRDGAIAARRCVDSRVLQGPRSEVQRVRLRHHFAHGIERYRPGLLHFQTKEDSLSVREHRGELANRPAPSTVDFGSTTSRRRRTSPKAKPSISNRIRPSTATTPPSPALPTGATAPAPTSSL